MYILKLVDNDRGRDSIFIFSKFEDLIKTKKFKNDLKYYSNKRHANQFILILSKIINKKIKYNEIYDAYNDFCSSESNSNDDYDSSEELTFDLSKLKKIKSVYYHEV